MANKAIISKTPDSLLPEIIPTTICQWQNCSIFGGNIHFSNYLLQLLPAHFAEVEIIASPKRAL